MLRELLHQKSRGPRLVKRPLSTPAAPLSGRLLDGGSEAALLLRNHQVLQAPGRMGQLSPEGHHGCQGPQGALRHRSWPRQDTGTSPRTSPSLSFLTPHHGQPSEGVTLETVVHGNRAQRQPQIQPNQTKPNGAGGGGSTPGPGSKTTPRLSLSRDRGAQPPAGQGIHGRGHRLTSNRHVQVPGWAPHTHPPSESKRQVSTEKPRVWGVTRPTSHSEGCPQHPRPVHIDDNRQPSASLLVLLERPCSLPPSALQGLEHRQNQIHIRCSR